VLFNVLNDEFVAGLIGLVPAHLPRSYSLQYAHIWCARCCAFGRCNFCKLVFRKVVQRHLSVGCGGICKYLFIANFLVSVTVQEIKTRLVCSEDMNKSWVSCFLTHSFFDSQCIFHCKNLVTLRIFVRYLLNFDLVRLLKNNESSQTGYKYN